MIVLSSALASAGQMSASFLPGTHLSGTGVCVAKVFRIFIFIYFFFFSNCQPHVLNKRFLVCYLHIDGAFAGRSNRFPGLGRLPVPDNGDMDVGVGEPKHGCETQSQRGATLVLVENIDLLGVGRVSEGG